MRRGRILVVSGLLALVGCAMDDEYVDHGYGYDGWGPPPMAMMPPPTYAPGYVSAAGGWAPAGPPGCSSCAARSGIVPASASMPAPPAQTAEPPR